jgi:CubicO group peptidase (beta-lactamase class C family)
VTETPTEVHGDSADGFDSVREAFASVFTEGVEVGAALAVTIDGRPVIDLWGGDADEARSRPWQRDSITNLYSVGKAFTAICALRLAESGVLDLDAPIARYWPEFAQAGKAEIPVRYLLTHQAGLPGLVNELPPRAIIDWDTMCDALAAAEPVWVPGERHGYHGNTQGFLVGEVLRRIDGRSLGTYLREEIAEPANIDFHIGLRAEHHARVADLIPMAPRPPDQKRPTPDNPTPYPKIDVDTNSEQWRSAEIPSTNGHGSARALARLYGALATGTDLDGVTILQPATIETATKEQVYGEDAVLGRVTRFGLGFQLAMAERPLGPNPSTFGHFGAGGSLGFADPDARLGFGYAMNRGRSGWQHRHVRHLIDVLYEAL